MTLTKDYRTVLSGLGSHEHLKLFDVLRLPMYISIASLLGTKDFENEMIIDEVSPPFIAEACMQTQKVAYASGGPFNKCPKVDKKSDKFKT